MFPFIGIETSERDELLHEGHVIQQHPGVAVFRIKSLFDLAYALEGAFQIGVAS